MKKFFFPAALTFMALLTPTVDGLPLKYCIPGPKLHDALYHGRISVAVKGDSQPPTGVWYTVVDAPRTANDPLLAVKLTQGWRLDTVERKPDHTYCEYNSNDNYFAITWINNNNQ